jgi:hypothetical protein
MPKSVHSVLARLFLARQPGGPARSFTWRLIRRRRRPFLLLPADATQTSVSLSLYSAQRRRAKIWRATMPLLLNTPLAAIFHRISFQAGENADIIRFLSEQSGVPAGNLPAPAIKFGGMADQKSRLVLLVCDQTNRPLKVVKVGLDESGRAATDREADLLEQLPAHAPGCTRVTGRLTTPHLSAFATDYFPGDSPEDDLGMETLFHAWVNPGSSEPIESFSGWQELEEGVASSLPRAWEVLRAALAGHRIRSTLHHGDFAPWNIRAVNLQNLQAFDWERGALRGLPAWDWFHFVVQTSILARRHSPERVAAEVELLLQSPRFKKYADFTGIATVVKPLLLAYLLHHRWVVKPLEGGRQVEELYELLCVRWDLAPMDSQLTASHATKPRPAAAARPGLWEDACGQLKSAWAQLANVFWEPTLTATVRPSLLAQVKARWLTALLCGCWLATLAAIQHRYLSKLSLLPFAAVAPLVATWKINRRWGTFFALLAALAGPAVAAVDQPSLRQPDLICWNTFMRFIIFQMCVFFADRIHRQKDFLRELASPRHRRADLAGNWAVVLISAIWFLAIGWGDFRTGPLVLFLPLYLFPAILITLFLNLWWGTIVVLLAAVNASTDEYFSQFNPNALEVFGWNFPMRFAILYTVILLLDRLRQESVLFANRRSNDGAKIRQGASPHAQ